MTYLEYGLPFRASRNSKGNQISGRMERQYTPERKQTTKLRDRLILDNPTLSHADHRSEIGKNANSVRPLSSGNRQKKNLERKSMDNEELVRYMSNLPSYLGRGEKLQEKAINVGVLDWRRLEKWQYNHRQMPRSSRCSLSSSNTSSFFSTDGSSARSSTAQSCSPARQQMHRPTLQAHLRECPKEDNFRGIKSFTGNDGNYQDLKPASSNPLKGQQSMLRTYQSFNKPHLEIKLKESTRRDSGPQISEYYGVPSIMKGKMKIQEGEFTREMEKLQEPCYNVFLHSSPERNKEAILPPRDDPKHSHPDMSDHSDLTATDVRRLSEASQRSFSDDCFSEGTFDSEVYIDIPYSCPLPCDIDVTKNSQIELPRSSDAKSFKSLSGPSEPSHCSLTMSSPSKSTKVMERNSISVRTDSSAIKSSKVSFLDVDTVVAAKVKNPSPTRRFIVGMGRIGRTSNSKDISTPPQLSSGYVTARSGPVISSSKDISALPQLSSKYVTASSGPAGSNSKDISALPQLSSKYVSARSGPVGSIPLACDNPNSNVSNTASRARSSPLRRLLDPLLKSKAANSHHGVEPSRKDLLSADRGSKPSNDQVDYSTPNNVRVKLNFGDCRTINVDDSHHNGKHGSSKVQALLQIAMKNGLPLFTFAVDSKSEILAATMRKLMTSRKDENSWIYTFFTVHEVKRKNGWMNHGGKGKGHNYIPNVVAQMKGSDSHSSKLRHSSSESIRQFVLFRVDLRQGDQQISDFQPHDELAAIVVKFPRDTPKGLNEEGKQSDNFDHQSLTGLKEEGKHLNSRDSEKNGPSFGAHGSFSTTVLLPGGVHGVPSKGEPSSLIERWKSGGACDCGGWDIGCRIKVLANQTQPNRRLVLSKPHSTPGQFELFSQGEVVEDRPVFSMSPFKDGIFSVEFSSSLTLLQAFSICLATLNSAKPTELAEFSNLFEEKFSEETLLVENDHSKAHNPVQVEIPARYASCPPHSPVGRV